MAPYTHGNDLIDHCEISLLKLTMAEEVACRYSQIGFTDLVKGMQLNRRSAYAEAKKHSSLLSVDTDYVWSNRFCLTLWACAHFPHLLESNTISLHTT